MKKILVTALSFCLTLIMLSACAQPSAPALVMRAKWYDDLNIEMVEPILEVLEYQVSFKAPDTRPAVYLEDISGDYTVSLGVEDGCYLYSTSLNTSGVYAENQERVEFTDAVQTAVKFKGLDKSLSPVSSSKSYDGYGFSPFGNGISNRVVKYDFSYVINYDGQKAKVDFTKPISGVLNEQSYSKLGKKSIYLDNEQLLFAIRGFDLTEKFSQSFTCISPVDGKVQTVSVTTGETPFSQLEFKDFSQNGAVSDKTLPAIKIQVSLSAKMSGSPLVCYYAAEKGKDSSFYQRLLRMESTLPGEMGTLVYTLKSVTLS